MGYNENLRKAMNESLKLAQRKENEIRASIKAANEANAATATASAALKAANAALLTKGLYSEKQKALLCGKHALNNILQESKFVWMRSKARYVDIEGNSLPDDSDPKNTTVKINFWAECNIYKQTTDREIKEEYLATESLRILKRLCNPPSDQTNKNYAYDMKNYEELVSIHGQCGNATIESIQAILDSEYIDPPRDESTLCNMGMDNYTGNMPFQLFSQNGIFDRLGYRFEKGVEEEYISDDSWKEKFRNEIVKPSLLGILINVPGHYIAIVKYSTQECKAGSYVLADSLRTPVLQCKPLETLIQTIKPKQMYYIYAESPDSYKSPAVKRMATLGGRRTFKKKKNMKRKSKKRLPKSSRTA